MALFGKDDPVAGPAPNLSLDDLRQAIAQAQASFNTQDPEFRQGGAGATVQGVPQLQAILDYMTQNGLTNTSQVPDALKQYLVPRKEAKTLAEQINNFSTSPPAMIIGGAALAGFGGFGSGTEAGTGGELTAEQWAASLTPEQIAGTSAIPAATVATTGTTPPPTTPPPTGGTPPPPGGIPPAVTTAAAGTALSRILEGNGTSEDYLSVLGQAAPAALSAYGSYTQSKELSDLAKRYEGYGAPYRSQLETISNDPSQFYNSPGAQQAMKSYNQSITPQTGNPAGSPYAQALGIESLYKQYGAERDRLAGFGGLTQYNQAAPGVATGAIGAQGKIYGDIGYGIGNVMNPQQNQNTLIDLLKAYNRSGGGY